MIHLIHGEDTQKSYLRLMELKTQYLDEGFTVREIDAVKANPAQWEEVLASDNLFEKDFLVISNFFDSREREIEELEMIDKNIILYEKKKLFKPPTGKLIKSEKFDPDPILFKFVDSLLPGKQSVFMPLFAQCLASNPWEMVHAMIVRQFRLMQYSHSQNLASDSEWLKLADWQRGKISAQAGQYTLPQLKKTYARLLESDWQSKTGQDGRTQLELLLIDL